MTMIDSTRRIEMLLPSNTTIADQQHHQQCWIWYEPVIEQQCSPPVLSCGVPNYPSSGAKCNLNNDKQRYHHDNYNDDTTSEVTMDEDDFGWFNNTSDADYLQGDDFDYFCQPPVLYIEIPQGVTDKSNNNNDNGSLCFTESSLSSCWNHPEPGQQADQHQQQEEQHHINHQTPNSSSPLQKQEQSVQQHQQYPSQSVVTPENFSRKRRLHGTSLQPMVSSYSLPPQKRALQTADYTQWKVLELQHKLQASRHSLAQSIIQTNVTRTMIKRQKLQHVYSSAAAAAAAAAAAVATVARPLAGIAGVTTSTTTGTEQSSPFESVFDVAHVQAVRLTLFRQITAVQDRST